MPCLYTVPCATTVPTLNKACCKPIFATLWFAYHPRMCTDKPLPVCVREIGPQSICGCSVQGEHVTAVTTGEILTSSTGHSLRRSQRGTHRDRFLCAEKKKRVSQRDKTLCKSLVLLYWLGKPVITKISIKHHVKVKVKFSFAPGLY